MVVEEGSITKKELCSLLGHDGVPVAYATLDRWLKTVNGLELTYTRSLGKKKFKCHKRVFTPKEKVLILETLSQKKNDNR